MINNMLAENVVQEFASPWASPIVLAQTKQKKYYDHHSKEIDFTVGERGICHKKLKGRIANSPYCIMVPTAYWKYRLITYC